MKRTWVVLAALGLFVSAVRAEESAGERVLHKEAIVPATPEEIWRVWTTSEGMAEWWVKDSTIDLKFMGPFELYLIPDGKPGDRGCDGCRVLSFVPNEMFSFEWSFPPKVPTLRAAGAKTYVVLRFEPQEDGTTKVQLDQLGWQQGDDWDLGFSYFDKAWGYVLELLTQHFAAKAERIENWIDGAVNVTAQYGARKLQKYEVRIPADVETVWDTLTTTDGVRSFLSPSPELDITPGGAYALFSGSLSKVISVVPQRQLVVTGSAPLEFPNVRMGGTWGVIDFSAADEGGTDLTMTCLGWQNGEEWDRAFDYFLKNNPMFLNLLRKRFTEGPLKWSEAGPGETATFTREPLPPAGA